MMQIHWLLSLHSKHKNKGEKLEFQISAQNKKGESVKRGLRRGGCMALTFQGLVRCTGSLCHLKSLWTLST